MIFVDTGVWYARYVRSDADHARAKAWFLSVKGGLLTTDYVVDELLTLLKARGHADVAYRIGGNLLSGVVCSLGYVQSVDLDSAWRIFSTHRDKGWSYTDCVNRAVIERLRITTAASFDDHFQQFGTLTVVP